MAGGKLISTGVEFPDATTQTTSGLPLTGGTMTGTIAGFTSTGIDDNATSTAITINASENVGVGAVSPTQRMQVDGGAVRVTGDQAALVSNQGLMLGFTGDEARHYAIGSSGGGVGEHVFYGYSYTTGAGSEHVRFPGTGGITFNGDTAAANALDDYEEGTWTPGLRDTASTADSTYSVQAGFYTKVGNKVHVQGRIGTSAIGTMSGSLFLTGLPFTAQAISQSYSTLQAGWGAGLAITAGESVAGHTEQNTTYIALKYWGTSDGVGTLTTTQWSANGDLIFSLDYLST